MRILAIDPGCTESGYALIDAETRQPLRIGKITNADLRELLIHDTRFSADLVAIEMVASYGMAVGKEVFETCVWVGRFLECSLDLFADVDLVYRKDIKLHHCGTSKAKDSNITQALIDRFASGQPNRGKGTKGEPGWFFGFKADIWQAFALAVYAADTADVPAPATSEASA